MKQSSIFVDSVSGSLWVGHNMLDGRVGNKAKEVDQGPGDRGYCMPCNGTCIVSQGW